MARPRIDGLYELGHVLYALNAEAHGFAPSGIAHVESFWTFGDMHSSSAGFVVALKDGRRAYIDFQHWHAFEQDEDFRIEVSPLLDGQRYPVLARTREPISGWSSDTAHLDRALAH
jgi:hypothetical protein